MCMTRPGQDLKRVVLVSIVHCVSCNVLIAGPGYEIIICFTKKLINFMEAMRCHIKTLTPCTVS